MSSLGTRAGHSSTAVQGDPIVNEGTALTAAERRFGAKVMDPASVRRSAFWPSGCPTELHEHAQASRGVLRGRRQGPPSAARA